MDGLRLHSSYSQLQLKGMFSGLSKLESTSFVTEGEAPAAMNLSSLENMFKGCSALTNVDLRNWSLKNLSDMPSMFAGAGTAGTPLTINLSWYDLKDASQPIAVASLAEGCGMPVTLIVGENYVQDGTDAYSMQMARIIGEFPEGTTVKAFEDSAIFRAPQRPAAQTTYTVEYYYDGVIDESQTVNTSKGIETREDGTAAVTYTVEPRAGYTMEILPETLEIADGEDSAKLVTLTVTESGENKIQVYYTTVPAEKPTYTVKYYYDGVIDESLTETFEAAEGDVISTFAEKPKDGYVFDSVSPQLMTVCADEENVIKVYYVTEEDTPAMVEYTVVYYLDEVLEGDLTETREVEDGTVIESYPDKLPVDYHLDTERTTALPFTVTEDGENIIRVYYVKNVTMVEYTVEYYLDGVRNDTLTEKNATEDHAEIESYLDKLPVGYHLDMERTTELPYTVIDGEENVIRVYYAQDVQEGSTDNTDAATNTESGLKDVEDEEQQEGSGYTLSLTRPSRSQLLSTETETGSQHYTEEELVPDKDYNKPLVTAAKSTPVGSTVNYKVHIKYEGDSGAQSGTINVRYPLPDGVEPVGDGSIKAGGVDGKDFSDADTTIGEFSLITEGSRQVLTGTVTGLNAGNTVEVQVTCKLTKLTAKPETINGTLYYCWDGTAYARTDRAAVSSNIMRLWWSREEEPTVPEDKDLVVVEYQYTGDVPEGVSPPLSTTKRVNQPVYSTKVDAPEGYSFDGWYKDGRYQLGTYYIQQSDVPKVIFVGKWSRKTTNCQVTIKYDLGAGAPEGLKIPDTTITAGTPYTIVTPEIPYYTFKEWESVDVKPTETYNIPLAGELDTSQFKQNTTITFHTTLEPQKGTIHFDATGGTVNPGSMKVILGKPEGELPTATREHYIFLGWATETDAAKPDYPADPPTPVSSLVGEGKPLNANDSSCILYAVWEPEDVTYTVKHLEKDVTPEKEVHSDQTFTGKFDAEVTANALTIDGYKLVDDSKQTQTLKLTGNPAQDVITFYYSRTNYALTVNTVLDDTASTLLVITNASPSYTLEAEQNWTIKVEGETFKSEGTTYTYPLKVAVTEDEKTTHYAFDPVKSTQTLTGSTAATVTLVYSLDEKGGTDPTDPGKDKPDGIPDKYQAFVTFQIERNSNNDPTGYWNGTDANPKTETVLLYKEVNGKNILATKEDGGVGHLTQNQIPSGTANTEKGYTGNGKWKEPAPSTETGIKENASYTLTWDLSNVSYTVTPHYRYFEENGTPRTIDGTSVTGEFSYGSKTLIELLPEGYNSAETYLTYDGKTYIFDDEATTYKSGNASAEATDSLTATARIDLYYDVDNWSEKDGDTPEGTPDGKADKYQVLVKFAVAENTSGNGTVSPTSKVYTLSETVKGGYQITGVTVKPTENSNSAFAFWTYPDKTTKTYKPDDLKLPAVVTGGSTCEYTATFLKDEKGNPTDPENKGDGIPDEYEAFVKFTTDDNGTLTSAEGESKNTITRAYDLRQPDGDSYKTENGNLVLKTSIQIGEYVGKPTDTSVNADVTAVANTNFAFDKWELTKGSETTVIQSAALKEDGALDETKATLAAVESLAVTPNGSYTYTASFKADTKGGTDPEKPGDGIPDAYQVTVTYVATKGGTVTVSGKAEAEDKTASVDNPVTLYLPVVGENNKLVSKGTVTFPKATAVEGSVGTTPYKFTKWTKQIGEANAEDYNTDAKDQKVIAEKAESSVNGGTEYTFTANFAANTHQVTFAWSVPADVDAPKDPPSDEQTVNNNATATKPTLMDALKNELAEKDCEFLGWYTKDTDGNLSTNEYDFDTPVTSDLTLYAKVDYLPQIESITKTANVSSVKTGGEITYTVTISPESGKGEMASFKVEDTVSDGTDAKKNTLTFGQGGISAEVKDKNGNPIEGSWKDGNVFELTTATKQEITLTYSITIGGTKADGTIDQTYAGWEKIVNSIKVTPTSKATPYSPDGNDGTPVEKSSDPIPYTKQITGVTKTLTDTLPMELTADKIKDGKLTLNYTIKVTGDAGAKFTIAEDPNAKITDPTGWSATKVYIMDSTGTMTFTATKEFAVSTDETTKVTKVTADKLSNTVTVTPVEGTVTPDGENPIVKESDEKAYQVIYKFEGDIPAGKTAPVTKIYKAGTEIEVEAAPEEDGYSFEGWTATGVTVAEDKFTMPTSDVTLTGTWEKLVPALEKVEKTVKQIGEKTNIQVEKKDGKRVVKDVVVTAGNQIIYQVKFQATPNTGLIKSFKLEDTLMSNPTVVVAGKTETGEALGKWTGNVYTLTEATAAEITVEYTYEVETPKDGDTVLDVVSNTATVTVWNGEASEAPTNPTTDQTKDSSIDVPYDDPKLEITKTFKGVVGKDNFNLETDKVYPGEIIEWTITVTNESEILLKDVKVKDTLEVPGVTGAVVDWPTGMILDDEGYVNIGDLAAGANKPFEVTYKVPDGYKPTSNDGKIKNTVAVKPDNGRTDTVNNPEKEIPTARQAVSIKKTVTGATDGKASVGNTLTYKITVTNKGNVDLKDLELTDTFTGRGTDPRAGVDGSYTFAASGKNDGVGTFTITSLPQDKTLTITYTYTVDARDAGDTVKNTVAIADSSSQVQDVNPTDPTEDPEAHETTTEIYAQATVKFVTDANYGTFAEDAKTTFVYTVATDGEKVVESPPVTLQNNCKLVGWVATSDQDGWSYPVTGDSVNVKLSSLNVAPGGTYTFTAQYKLDVTKDDVKTQLQGLFPIEISCEKAETTHHAKDEKQVAVTFESGIVENGEVTVTAKVTPADYAAKYTPGDVKHTAKDTKEISKEIKLTLGSDGKWTGSKADTIQIVTTCDVKKPVVNPGNDDPKLPDDVLDANVTVECYVKNTNHKKFEGQVKDVNDLAVALDISDVAYDEKTGAATCTVTVKPDQYIGKFNDALPGVAEHKLYPADGQTWTIDLVWNGTAWTVKTGSELSKTFTVANDARDITEFKVAVGGKTVEGKVEGENITITVPNGSDLKNLTPEIEHSGVSITPTGAQDFSKTGENEKVKYTVTAEDTSTKGYTVIVKVELPVDPKDPTPNKPDPVDLGTRVILNPGEGAWKDGKKPTEPWDTTDGGKTYEQTVESGQEIKLPTKDTPDQLPEKDGHRFDHWEVSVSTDKKTVTYTAKYVQQYIITVVVENGTSKVTVSNGESTHEENSNNWLVDINSKVEIGFAPNDGMALYTAKVGDTNVFAEVNKNKGYTFEKVTADQTITVVYSKDSLKETKDPTDPEQPSDPGSKTEGDGIADKYQVLVEYKTTGTAGTTTPEFKVYTLTDAEGNYIESGKIDISSTAKAGAKSAFVSWTYPDGTKLYDSVLKLENVAVESAKSPYIYTAAFGRDETVDPKVPEDQRPTGGGDGIPDSWQYTVTFTAGTGGTLSGPTSVVVTRRDAEGKPAENGTAHLTADQIPAASANRDYRFNNWNPETPTVSLEITSDRTFTANFVSTYVPLDPDPTPTPRPTPTPDPTPAEPSDPGTNIGDEQTPLAAPGLNSVDHFDYIKGYDDGTVRPEANITRAEVATIFFRLMTNDFRAANWATENSFSDVAAGQWYNNAISTCARAGILAGYPEGDFRPENSITRAEFASIAARFASEEVPSGGMFPDIEGHWAQKDIERATAAGWIKGDNGRFRPEDRITRAEVIVVINRMLDRVPDAEHLLDGMKTFPDNTPDKWYYAEVQEATNSHDYERDELGVGEIWTELLPAQEWAALEKVWATAADANINDVAANLKEEEAEGSEESKETEE